MTHKANERMSWLFLMFGFIYLIIAVNLFYIQILRSDFFIALGKQQYQTMVTIAPARAPILDCTGKQFLALNKEGVAAFILPNQLQDPQSVSEFLAEHFPVAFKRLQQHDKQSFMYIKRRLSDVQIQLIKEANLPDIKLLNEPTRFYPVSSAAQIIGITDIDNKGIMGIELYCNQRLAGQPMVTTLEKDARSGYFYFDKKTKMSGIQGEPLQLTISSDLQFLVDQELQAALKKFNASEGSVIIINPATGAILAMTNAPNFDPNDTGELAIEHTKNRIISDAYELGSVFKVFAAMAALQEKVVSVDELIDCQSVPTGYVDGRKINTVPSSVRGIVPFYEVIAVSNNIGIATVAVRVGKKMYDYYRRLGFGEKVGISLPGEHAGSITHPYNWSKHSIISLSYGYEVSATLLQLARAFCIIANDGYDVRLRIIANEPIIKGDQPLFDEQTIRVIKDILDNATQQGSSRRAAIKGYRVMSKTGTANMLVNGAYDTKRNIYTCAGIVQKDTYLRVVVVSMKEAHGNNLYASTVAAPLFEKVAQKMLIHDKAL